MKQGREKSLRRKLSQTMLALTVASIVVLSVTTSAVILRMREAFRQYSLEAGSAAAAVSSQSMHEQMSARLLELARDRADASDEMFREFKQAVRMVADMAEELYRRPADYPARTIPRPVAEQDGELSVQLLFSQEAEPDSAAIRREVELLGNAQDMLYVINRNFPQMASNYIATESGIMVQADTIAASKFDASGALMPYEAKERPWYRGAVESGEAFLTQLTRDYHTERSGIMCGIPVYRDGEVMGVSGAGIYLDDLEASVMSARLGENGYACVIDEDGEILFSSRRDGDLSASPDQAANFFQTDDSALSTLAESVSAGENGIILANLNGVVSYIAYAPMPNAGWYFLTIIPEEEIMAPTQQLLAQLELSTDHAVEAAGRTIRNMSFLIVAAVVLLFAGALVSSLRLADVLSRPIRRLTEQVHNIQGDRLDFHWEYQTGDETQTLAEAFASMTERMKQYITDITVITAEKERISAELNVATQIQADMLPRIFPAFPERKEFDLFASMNPAKEVGGDFYDYFLIDEDHLAVVMADVSGKGVPAALFMVIAKTLLKNRAQAAGADLRPGKILADVNNQLCEGNEAELFVTVWLGILTISTGRLISASAGHEYPAFYRTGAGFALEKDKHGLPLAAMEGLRFRETETELKHGEALFIYTDGVTEATSAQEELFGEGRMVSALNAHAAQTPEEIIHGVRREIDAFVKDAPQFDDITMLCLRFF